MIVNSNVSKVTVDNFCRAETDTYFARHVKDAGGTGCFRHIRQPVQADYQPVIRMNRDTLYSGGVFDLAEPATITFPEAGGRFMSMMVLNQDHYVKLVTYEPGDHTLTREAMGTRYVEVIFRTFVDPDNPEDILMVNVLQDRIGTAQRSRGVLESPDWDIDSLNSCRAALLGLAPFLPDNRRTFGDVNETDLVRHLIGTARGWGGNPEKDAFYRPAFPSRNDGRTPYLLELKDVPVEGFWSISVYNSQGYFEKNEYGAYSLNNVTAAPNVDGSYTIHFGGDPSAANFLYIMPGWNYTLRLYRPRQSVLDGSWVVPESFPAG